MTSLFVDRKLNFDEAVRRLEHWATELSDSRAKGAISSIASVLKLNRDSLYFEPETER